MGTRMLWLGPGLALAGALGAAGCAGPFEDRPLELTVEPECAAPAQARRHRDYWLLGTAPPAVNWAGCDKTGAQLSGADLSGADLTFADLSEADLRGADLSGALATGAKLRWADLRGARLTSLYLKGADLRGADLTGADLRGVKLTDVDLSGATWSDGTTVCAEGSIGRCR